jgi:hypothetical protein
VCFGASVTVSARTNSIQEMPVIIQFRILCPPVCYIKTYKNIILPVALNGCETLSLTLEEEYTFKLYENRMLSRT